MGYKFFLDNLRAFAFLVAFVLLYASLKLVGLNDAAATAVAVSVIALLILRSILD